MTKQNFKKKSILKHFPKVELHRHIEGTFALKTLHKIAMKNKLSYSKDFKEFKEAVQFPKDSEPDFLKFLSKFKNDWYRSRQDITDIIYASVKEFLKDGIFYIELRFSPEHFSFYNNYDRSDISRLVIDAANVAAKEINVNIRYLITFNRGRQKQEEMLALYKKILKLNITEIVGIDLAGDETQFPPSLFVDFFNAVKTDNIGATIHAGEVTPPKQIWESIELLHAKRIGHGTSSIKDIELQKTLSQKNIVLEQCITSNYQTGSWINEKNHPLGRLYRAGVPVTINSDDPTIQNTDLTDDYLKACKYFNFSIEDLITLNINAINGAFLPQKEKDILKAQYLEAVKKFRKTHTV